MAVNFNSNSVFNLKPINVEEVRKEVDGLLIGGEQIEFLFQWMCRELREKGNHLQPCRIPKFSIFQFKHRVFWK